jgi:hypothetical protein
VLRQDSNPLQTCEAKVSEPMLSPFLEQSSLNTPSAINFGCNPSDHYKNYYVISEGSSLKVSPDGHLSVSNTGLAFSRVYSTRMLLPEYCEEFISDTSTWLKNSHTSKKIHESSRSITKYFHHKFIFLLFKYLFGAFYQELDKLHVLHLIENKLDDSLIATALEDILHPKGLQSYSAGNSALVACVATSMALQIPLSTLLARKACASSSSKDDKAVSDKTDETEALVISIFTKLINENNADFSEKFCHATRTLLAEIFNSSVSGSLLNKLIGDKDRQNAIDYIAKLILKNKKIKHHFFDIFETYIDEGLVAVTKSKLNEAVKLLQTQVTPAIASSEIEELIISQLKKHLTQNEMDVLESRRIFIVATSQNVSCHHQCKGIFDPIRNTIFVKIDNISSSLIHEIQHSLGFDIKVGRCLQFFKFYYQCKLSKLSIRSGLTFEMEDLQNVLKLESSDKNLSPTAAKMFHRAKYILSLKNYSSSDRTTEILAHFRQFIADFGVDQTKNLLPKLFNFWKTEILDTSINQAALDIHNIKLKNT